LLLAELSLGSGWSMRVSVRIGWLLLLGCAATHGLQTAQHFEGDYEEEYDEEDGLPFAPEVGKFARKVQASIDSEGLLRARRWGNIANGVLLGMTGPVTLAVSAFGLKLSGVVLSSYMTAAGALLACIELGVEPIAPWAKENLSWMTKQGGKTALLFFAGGLAWAFGKAGLVPALLTIANALFNLKFRSVLGFVTADDDEQPYVDDEVQAEGVSEAAGFDEQAGYAEEPDGRWQDGASEGDGEAQSGSPPDHAAE